jgi:hypothetical protein
LHKFVVAPARAPRPGPDLCDAAAMREILAAIVGRPLDAITEARHWRDGVPGDSDDALIDLWLYFRDRPAVHVCGDDTGTRLVLTFDEPYASYEMGPYGEFRVEPVAAGSPLADFVGHRLDGAAVLDAGTGVWLRFDHRDIVIAERDDDFVFITDAGKP